MIPKISDEKIEELRVVCEKEYGQAFFTEDAQEIAHNVFAYIDCVSEILNQPGVSEEIKQHLKDHTDLSDLEPHD